MVGWQRHAYILSPSNKVSFMPLGGILCENRRTKELSVEVLLMYSTLAVVL